jgi:hypothetical protein
MTGNRASGNTPPMTKMISQPKRASNAATARPPTKPPNGAPVNCTMIKVARRRCGV